MVLHTGLWLVFTGALMFCAAGRVEWRQGWAFLVVMGVSSFAMGFWLARRDPALLAKRMGPLVQKGQTGADKLFLPIALVLFYVWLVLMALDGGRFGWSSVPVWMQALGAGLMVASMLLCAWVFRENSFAAPVVKVQAGQSVISTGPYALVRHPMYAGAIKLFVGAPLLLGSWWGLLVLPVYLIGIGWRARHEEKTLIDALPGYADYVAQVRWRLAPLIW